MNTNKLLLIASVGAVLASMGWRLGDDVYHWAKGKSKNIKFRSPVSSDSENE